jgi:hypothetical protein
MKVTLEETEGLLLLGAFRILVGELSQ